MKVEETSTLPTLDLLRRVPIFSGLSDDDLRLLSNTLAKEIYAKNRVIIHEGKLSNNMFIVVSGRVKVQVTSRDEGRDVILAVLGPGEFFGEMSLIDQHPASASVITLETSHLIVVSKQDFRLQLLAFPDIALNLMRGLVKHLRMADKKIESLALHDVDDRVKRVLLDLSEMVEGQLLVREKLPSRQEIAKMVGASREMVSRAMKSLEQAGFFTIRLDGSLLINEQHQFL